MTVFKDKWGRDAETCEKHCNPGIERIELRGAPGYDEERLVLQNSLGNGLRLLIEDTISDDSPETFLAHFHFHSPEAAKFVAAKLIEWSDRIANPASPNTAEDGEG